MMMRTLVLSFVVVVSTALVAAGCGGGGGKSRNKAYDTKAAYGAALDSICAATNRAGNSLDLSSTEKIAANGDKAKDLFSKMAHKIDELEPPDAVKTQAQSFVDDLEQEADQFGDMTQAAKDGDTAKVTEIQGKLASEAAATSEDARFVGATGCARLFS
jgi:ornithine cyclodeaminase/alanine dehydrogenase-like protein (mu-crystallin family)